MSPRTSKQKDSKARRGGARNKQDLGASISYLVGYCHQYAGLIVAAFAFSAVSAVLSVAGPSLIARLTKTISEGVSPTGIDIDLGTVNGIGMTLIAVYVASMALDYLQSLIMSHVSCNVGNRMRSEITRKINRMPLRYFDSHSQGDTLSRVTNDVDTISQSLNTSVGTFVSSITIVVGCIVMMTVTEWRMSLTAVATTLLGFIAMGRVMGVSQKYFVARQESLAQLNGHVEELYAGQIVVRAYNAEECELQAFRDANERLREHTFRAEFLSRLLMPIMTFVGNLGYVAVCIVGAALAFGGSIDFAIVIAFIIYVRLFSTPLSSIGQGFASIQAAAAASARVESFLAEEELTDESDKTERLSDVCGAVSFDHVRFGYVPEKTIIHDFSARVEAGQKVAIVGPTGAGKTTLVNLLMRFYELDGGAIAIDGAELADLTRKDVHDAFGMVLQDTWLFEGTVRENLTYGKEGISDDDLLDACARCGLTHFIDTLPQGLDTQLNDTVSISAGQKQLLTIARAMVADSPMLILDEATSSVDTRTEEQIQRAMDEVARGRTSFVIAHRLSTIKNADLIIYMQDGDIRETGTHDELMERGGLYAELYNSQFSMSA